MDKIKSPAINRTQNNQQDNYNTAENEFQAIPNELKLLKQWVIWKKIPRKNSNKFDKIPYNACTGQKALSNNPSTWTNFKTAYKSYKLNKFDGVGFMFANGYFGVDIDSIDSDIENFKAGKTENIVSEFIDTLNSYAEYSPSGKGIHIICKGKLPDGRRRKGSVEMYQEGRCFTMTGNSINNSEIRDCTIEIEALHKKYLGTEEAKIQISTQNNSFTLSDSELIQKAINSKNGYKFEELYQGNWKNYNSQSDADLSFCNLLAYWTGKNMAQMDAIFRSSGLMRDKWNKRVGGSTYGKKTLERAIRDCSRCYDANYKTRGAK